MVILRNLLPAKQRDEGDKKRMGRWAVLTMTTPNKQVARSGRIRVMTAYRATATDSGDNSTLNQQRRSLLQQGRLESPQKAFEKDITGQMSRYHTQGDAIILSGDFNSPISERILQSLSHKFSLVDVMSQRMKETPPHPRSRIQNHRSCTSLNNNSGTHPGSPIPPIQIWGRLGSQGDPGGHFRPHI